MEPVILYNCRKEELPSVEAILAAHGYAIEIPRQRSLGGQTTLVMSNGDTVVLLAYKEPNDTAAIEIWGAARMATVDLLRSAPLQLTRQPAPLYST